MIEMDAFILMHNQTLRTGVLRNIVHDGSFKILVKKGEQSLSGLMSCNFNDPNSFTDTSPVI